jgi:hypothetical protein
MITIAVNRAALRHHPLKYRSNFAANSLLNFLLLSMGLLRFDASICNRRANSNSPRNFRHAITRNAGCVMPTVVCRIWARTLVESEYGLGLRSKWFEVEGDVFELRPFLDEFVVDERLRRPFLLHSDFETAICRFFGVRRFRSHLCNEIVWLGRGIPSKNHFKFKTRNPFITAPASFFVKSYAARQSGRQTKSSLASTGPDQGVALLTFQ